MEPYGTWVNWLLAFGWGLVGFGGLLTAAGTAYLVHEHFLAVMRRDRRGPAPGRRATDRR